LTKEYYNKQISNEQMFMGKRMHNFIKDKGKYIQPSLGVEDTFQWILALAYHLTSNNRYQRYNTISPTFHYFNSSSLTHGNELIFIGKKDNGEMR